MNKRDKIREMKNVVEKMAKLNAIRKSMYDGAVEELGLIDDDFTFDFFHNGPYSRKQAENILSVEFPLRERWKRFPKIVNAAVARCNPYEQGKQAFHQGVCLIHNPFAKWSNEYNRWYAGWKDEWWRTATWRPR